MLQSSEVELDIDKKSDQITPESEKVVAESVLADEGNHSPIYYDFNS